MSHSRPLEVFVLRVVELENKTFFSSKFTITELNLYFYTGFYIKSKPQPTILLAHIQCWYPLNQIYY